MIFKRYHRLTLIFLILLVSGFSLRPLMVKKPPQIGAPVFSPNGQYLLFHADYPKGRVLYRVKKDGTELTQLSPSGADCFDPSYSPDGSKIVYAKKPSGKFGEQSDLYVMNSDGSDKRQITTGPAHDSGPIFSPDGLHIYFVRARWFGHHSPFVSSQWHDKDLYAVTVDGAKLTAVTDGWYYEISRPSVSLDGKQILVRAISPMPLTDEEALASIKEHKDQDSLWMISVANPQDMRPIRPNLQKYLTEESMKQPTENRITYENLYEPQFSPDSQSIIFKWTAKSDHRGYFIYEIYSMDLQTGNVKRITGLKRNVAFSSFSPNGREIVFLWDSQWPKRDSPYELWIINSDGTSSRRIDIKL